MWDMYSLLEVSPVPWLEACALDAGKHFLYCYCHSADKRWDYDELEKKKYMGFLYFFAITKIIGTVNLNKHENWLVTSRGLKSAPRLNVISKRNLLGSSRGTCISSLQHLLLTYATQNCQGKINVGLFGTNIYIFHGKKKILKRTNERQDRSIPPSQKANWTKIEQRKKKQEEEERITCLPLHFQTSSVQCNSCSLVLWS